MALLAAVTGAPASAQVPAPPKWVALPPLPHATSGAAAAVMGSALYVFGGWNGAGGTAATQILDLETGAWRTGASMPGPRFDGTGAVSLGEYIYVVGGNKKEIGRTTANSESWTYHPATNMWYSISSFTLGAGCGASGAIGGKLYVLSACYSTSTTEKQFQAYDPVQRTWTRLASPNVVHESPGFGVINGKFYVAGGGGDKPGVHGVVEAYYPATDTWTTLASLPTPRLGAGSAVLNGRLYVIGGHDENYTAGHTFDTVESYDPATNTWRAEPRLAGPRGYIASAATKDSIFAIGGGEGLGGAFTTAEVFAPATGWRVLPTPAPTSAPAWGPGRNLTVATSYSASVVLGDRAYVLGGRDAGVSATRAVQAFDLGTGSWDLVAPLPEGRYDMNGAVALDGMLLVAGGRDNAGNPRDNLWAFDPARNAWSEKARMPAVAAAGASGLIGGKMYVTSAVGPGSIGQNILYRYDPVLNTWATLAPSAEVHRNAAWGALGGKLFVAGGLKGSSTVLASMEVFDPETGAWSKRSSLLTARHGAASAVFDGRLFVIGGRGSPTVGEPFSTVESYDPATDTWQEEPSLWAPRQFLAAAAADGALFAFGGLTRAGAPTTAVEAFPEVPTWSPDPRVALEAQRDRLLGAFALFSAVVLVFTFVLVRRTLGWRRDIHDAQLGDIVIDDPSAYTFQRPKT